MAPYQGLVYMLLVLPHPFEGELALGFFEQRLGQVSSQLLVRGQPQDVPGEELRVPGLEHQACLFVYHQRGDAAHVAGDGRAVVVGSLQERIREGLREGRQHIDVHPGEIGLYIAYPPFEDRDVLDAQLLRKAPQLCLLIADARDGEPEPFVLRICHREGLHQRRDVLDRVEPCRYAHYDGILLILEGPRLLRCAGEIHAVVQGEYALGIEAPVYEELPHAPGHGDVVIHAPKCPAVDHSEGVFSQRSSHVVQLGIRMDGGHHRHSPELLYYNAYGVGLGSVAVDELGPEAVALVQGEADGPGIALLMVYVDHVDAHLRGFG